MKLFLFKTWTRNTGVDGQIDEMSEEQLDMLTFIGQMLQYLFAEDPNDFGEAPPEQIKRIKQVRKTVPADSYEIMMREDGKFSRQIIVYTLRIKTYLHTMLEGAEWIDTPDGKRTWDILQIYGAEFPEEVDDKAFNKLVKQVLRTTYVNDTLANSKK